MLAGPEVEIITKVPISGEMGKIKEGFEIGKRVVRDGILVLFFWKVLPKAVFHDFFFLNCSQFSSVPISKMGNENFIE